MMVAMLPIQVRAQRSEILLDKGWRFHLGDVENGQDVNLDDSKWDETTIPHDWAIAGPFDRKWDLQNVAVKQNGENVATWKTGRTGGLPHIGAGWYRTKFNAPSGKHIELLFDGAMSQSQVYVNGEKVMFWPYGYNSFTVDITNAITTDGSPNTLAVRLENMEQSSRWYPGAGLYRNVHIIYTDTIYVPTWGTQLTTPHVEESYASICLKTTVEGCADHPIRILTNIIDQAGNVVATKDNTAKLLHGEPLVQNFIIDNPSLWSPDHPALYEARSEIYADTNKMDQYTTRFGIRSIEMVADKGFFLNGQPIKFQGVCLHHDLGPLGSAVNKSAIRHQLTLLKDIGCNAIRTSHNMPTPELVELCDEMGLMMMVEPFDEWDIAKCQNGYHLFFPEWAERDMINMLRHYRNNPSVVMWSIGNEVPSQWRADGYKTAQFLQDICHREDPTRPVTCGMDQVSAVLHNGFAATLDIPGLNYHTDRYQEAYHILPQCLILGSETSSTVSSRGTYMFPAEIRKDAMYDNHQSSGYDLEACSWSNLPDEDFALAEDYEWTLGQFVWTGFDYLGEPSPYDTDAWPSHSSLFGIIDLASLPKDRYYLYRSHWANDKPTLHILPHWTWPGREGEITPVFVYTNSPSAELFINGKSQGIQHKLSVEESNARKEENDPYYLQRRYRLIWENTVYEPGELKVVTYDDDGNKVAQKTLKTAGAPHHLEMTTDRTHLVADGKDLCYITVNVVDKDGNLCPNANNLIQFSVTGAGTFLAAANGDPTNLEPFHLPQHTAFAGQLTAIVQTTCKPGNIIITAKTPKTKHAVITLPCQ